jgi:hypothetical protein
LWGRDGQSIKLFLPNRETKYFCKRLWTAKLQNSLTGKSPLCTIPLCPREGDAPARDKDTRRPDSFSFRRLSDLGLSANVRFAHL